MTASTRMRPLFGRLFPVILFFAITAGTGRAQTPSTFSLLAYLPVGSAGLMSENGHLILGQNYEFDGDGNYYDRCYIWQLNGTQWDLGYLNNDASLPIVPMAVSADASTISGYVGRVTTDPDAMWTSRSVAAIWHQDNGVWTRTELYSGPDQNANAYINLLSKNGQIAAGTINGYYDGERAYVWEHQNDTWTNSPLTVPDGARTTARGISADGSIIVGGSYLTNPSGFLPVVWTKGDNGWFSTILPHDPATRFYGPTAVTPDGTNILGSTTVKGDQRIAVWHFDGAKWNISILPSLGTGDSFGYYISADGTLVIGTATLNPDGSGIRTVWQLKNNKWAVTRSGKSSEVDGYAASLTQDGKLCLADIGNDVPAIWNLVNGSLISLADLVAGVDLNNSTTGWDFSYARLENIGYDETNNSYNIVGYAKHDGQITFWVSTVFAPFLTSGDTIIGQQIDAPLPDHQEGAYTVDNLPSGLTYKSVNRTVSGRPTKAGVFSIRYRSSKGKIRTTLLNVVPMPAKMTGAQTLPLAAASSGDPSPGVLSLKIGPTGALSGSLKLNSSPKAQTLKLSGMMIVESSGKFSAAYATQTATTPGITLKLGKGTSLVQLQLSLHMSRDGILIAELRDANNDLIGSATSD